MDHAHSGRAGQSGSPFFYLSHESVEDRGHRDREWRGGPDAALSVWGVQQQEVAEDTLPFASPLVPASPRHPKRCLGHPATNARTANDTRIQLHRKIRLRRDGRTTTGGVSVLNLVTLSPQSSPSAPARRRPSVFAYLPTGSGSSHSLRRVTAKLPPGATGEGFDSPVPGSRDANTGGPKRPPVAPNSARPRLRLLRRQCHPAAGSAYPPVALQPRHPKRCLGHPADAP